MPISNGQASGGWTESSSALRILNVGIRNSLAKLTTDGFTQSNPPVVSSYVSDKVDPTVHGVLSGSVCFTRPDAGGDFVGGPGSAAVLTALNGNVAQAQGFKVLGVFVNDALGSPFCNQPAVASGICTYVCAMGTYGNKLYETKLIGAVVGGDPAVNTTIVYGTGLKLIASKNGYLTPKTQLNNAGAAIISCDSQAIAAESYVLAADNSSTLVGVVKMPPDAVQNEIVYDQLV